MEEEQTNTENYSSKIFYFTGTGNSLHVALKIQEKVKNCQIFSISKSFKEKKLELDASTIGFIFPVYFLDVPHIVREFLNDIKILGNPYIFAIATCGGELGNTFKKVNKLLQKQNKQLNAEFKVIMPSNSIVMFNHTTTLTPEENTRKIERSEGEIENIIEIINQKQAVSFNSTGVPFKNRFVSSMGKFFLFHLINDRTFKVDEDKCTSCGTCVSVCPMNNIELKDGKPTWNHDCECCAGCIHWCPCEAIENMRTRGIPRYHHPEITPKTMKSF